MNSNSNNGRAIIYLRKSTDREDRQQISIETQRQHCERLAKDNNFDTFTIEDHKSAKEEGKRPGFKQMLSLCKKGGYDYVIAYDPTRVSRNTIDAAYFTELINKNHIKGFYAAETRPVSYTHLFCISTHEHTKTPISQGVGFIGIQIAGTYNIGFSWLIIEVICSWVKSVYLTG